MLKIVQLAQKSTLRILLIIKGLRGKLAIFIHLVAFYPLWVKSANTQVLDDQALPSGVDKNRHLAIGMPPALYFRVSKLYVFCTKSI